VTPDEVVGFLSGAGAIAGRDLAFQPRAG